MECIAVDWSGARDTRKKIWLAKAKDRRITELENCRTREDAIESVLTAKNAAAGRGEDLVVGLDFAFSFPAWFLDRKGCESAVDFWQLAENEGDRWVADPLDSPFYTHGRWGDHARNDRHIIYAQHPEYRRTEEEIVGRRPASVFRLFGQQQVGKASLKGMPQLLKLREKGFRIWPFDRPRLPLVVEIYPRVFYGNIVKTRCSERDRWLKKEKVRFRRQRDRDKAVDSDDAFDAAVSAWFMSLREEELRNLGEVDEPFDLEGKIWLPEGD